MHNLNITVGNINVIHLIINIQIMLLLTYNKYVFSVADFDSSKIKCVGLLKTGWTALKSADIFFNNLDISY